MGKVVTIEFNTEESAQIFYDWSTRQDHIFGDPVVKSVELDWHTPHELYEHRYHLYRALVFSGIYRFKSWRSRLHHDETMFEDSFIVGINLVTGISSKRNDITYHLPLSWWESFDGITTYDKAPEYDGASPEEGLRRLEAFVDANKEPNRMYGGDRFA